MQVLRLSRYAPGSSTPTQRLVLQIGWVADNCHCRDGVLDVDSYARELRCWHPNRCVPLGRLRPGDRGIVQRRRRSRDG